MRLGTFGNWTGAISGVGAGALTASPDYQFLAPYLAATSGVVWLLTLIWFLCANRHEIRSGAKKLGSWFFIIPCIGLALLGIAGAAYGLGLRSTITTKTAPNSERANSSAFAQVSANSLQDKISAFLAKNGKSGRLSGTDGDKPDTFAVAENPDSRRLYISHWGADLGIWPTRDDGFDLPPLRDLPKKVPKFNTQFDREKFRGEVSALQTILHQKIGTIIRLSHDLAPISPTPEHRAEYQQTLLQIAPISQEVEQLLFVRGSGGNGTFFDAATYRELLMGTLPDDWQERWVNYKFSRNELHKALALMESAERHPEDAELLALAKTNVGIPKDQFQQKTGALREWLDRTDACIALLISAI